MPQNKYNIGVQVSDWDELMAGYTQEEIVGMCDAYLRSRIRSKLTREGQATEFKAYKAAKKAGLIGSNGATS